MSGNQYKIACNERNVFKCGNGRLKITDNILLEYLLFAAPVFFLAVYYLEFM
jgi:hypothetical protein